MKKRTKKWSQAITLLLTFYINRAGTKLDPAQKKVLMKAKQELRGLFGKS